MTKIKHVNQLFKNNNIGPLIENFNSTRICPLYGKDPNCIKNSIESHSITKSWLNTIAVNNKVIGWNSTFNFKMIEEQFSISHASTFYGFCQNCENIYFNNFENKGILSAKQLSKKDIIAISFRNIAKKIYIQELHMHLQENSIIPNDAKIDRTKFIKFNKNIFNIFYNEYKNDTNKLKYISRIFTFNEKFLSSHMLGDISIFTVPLINNDYEVIFCFPRDGKIDEFKTYSKFVETAFKIGYLKNEFLFKENLFFSPTSWENVDQEQINCNIMKDRVLMSINPLNSELEILMTNRDTIRKSHVII